MTLVVASGLPAGATANFGPTNPKTTTGANVTWPVLSISTTASTPTGTHTILLRVLRGIDCQAQGNGNIDSDNTISLTVTGGNTAPVAVNDGYSVAEDGALTVPTIGVLANDTDADGNTLTVAAPRPVSAPTNGSLTLNANGSFTYTPNADYFGSDSFTYRANDGTADSNLATVSITVTEVNDAPTAVNDTTTVAEDGSVTFDPRPNDSKGPANESTQTLTITAVTQGTQRQRGVHGGHADVHARRQLTAAPTPSPTRHATTARPTA